MNELASERSLGYMERMLPVGRCVGLLLSPVQLYSSSSWLDVIHLFKVSLCFREMKRTASNQSISLPGMSLGALGTALGPCVPGCLTDHIFSFQGWLSLTASSCEMWSSSNPILKQADLLRTSTKNGTRLLTLWDPRCLFPVTNPHFPQIPPFLHVSTEEGNRGENWDQLLRCDQVRNL